MTWGLTAGTTEALRTELGGLLWGISSFKGLATTEV